MNSLRPPRTCLLAPTLVGASVLLSACHPTGSDDASAEDDATETSDATDADVSEGDVPDLPKPDLPEECEPPPSPEATRTVWTEIFDLGSSEVPMDISALADGRVVVVGILAESNSDVFVSVHDPDDGAEIWSTSLDRRQQDSVVAVVPRPDGGFVFAGTLFPNEDAWVVSFDGDYAIDWELEISEIPTLISGGKDQAVDLEYTSNGDLLLLGYTRDSPTENETASWLVSIPPTGGMINYVDSPGINPVSGGLAVSPTDDMYVSGEGDGKYGVFRTGFAGESWWLELPSDQRVLGPPLANSAGGLYWVGDVNSWAESQMGRIGADGELVWKQPSGWCDGDAAYLPTRGPGMNGMDGPAFVSTLQLYLEHPSDGSRTLIQAHDADGEPLWFEPVFQEEPTLRTGARLTTDGHHAYVAGIHGESGTLDFFISRMDI